MLALCVVVHLVTMIVAVRGGLTAAEILGRTRGSVAWAAFYGVFVVAVAIHAPIGVRTIVAEVRGAHGRGIDAAMLAFALLLLALGLRAVAAVTMGSARMTDASIRRGDWRARGHAGWWAFAVHRVSGLALALFLPVHFLVLGAALNGAAALDAALGWTEQPWVKASEIVLVFLLAAHLGGGLRLLLVEFHGWRAASAAGADRDRRGRRDAVRAAVRAEPRLGRRCGSRRIGSRMPRRSSTCARCATCRPTSSAGSRRSPRARPARPRRRCSAR